MVGCNIPSSLVISQATSAKSAPSWCTQMTFSLLQQQWNDLFYFAGFSLLSCRNWWRQSKPSYLPSTKIEDHAGLRTLQVQVEAMLGIKSHKGKIWQFTIVRLQKRMFLWNPLFFFFPAEFHSFHYASNWECFEKCTWMPGMHQAEGSLHCCDTIICTWQILQSRDTDLTSSPLPVYSHIHIFRLGSSLVTEIE